MGLIEGEKLPKSDATNAFDLCMDAARAIREEPLRYNQEVWLEQEANFIAYVLDGVSDRLPACGTMACRAGWLTVLTRRMGADVRGAARELLGDVWNTDRPYQFTTDVLGLFSGEALERWNEEGDKLLRPAIGTPEYAELGAAGLEEFAKKWEEWLKMQPIPPKVRDEAQG